MASTVVICSCSQKNLPSNQNESLRIGVQSALLSFDPLSFQSLGEQDIRELVYTKVFSTEGQKISSPVLSNIRFFGRSVIFDKPEKKILKEMKLNFEKGQSSVLWKDVFLKFKLENKRITYVGENNFISDLMVLEKIFLLESEADYKITSHKKGVYLILEANNKHQTPNKIRIDHVKSVKSGLDLLVAKKIDVFIPSGFINKGLLESYGNNLKVMRSNDLNQKIRLYSKSKDLKRLDEFCEHKKSIPKLIGEGWVIEKDSCHLDSYKKKLKVIYTDATALKILDFISYQSQSARAEPIAYERLSGQKLTKALLSGDFDLHLSLERVGVNTPVSFDAFHSKGAYNTYKVSSPKLDRSLEKLSKTHKLDDYKSIHDSLKKDILDSLPLVFSYTRPSVDYILPAGSELKKAKSSKRLIFSK